MHGKVYLPILTGKGFSLKVKDKVCMYKLCKKLFHFQ